MKRIFIVFSLLFCLGVSAPLASAADSFDVNKTLAENLAEWVDGSKSSAQPLPGFGSSSLFDIALIYANPEAGLARAAAGLANYKGFDVVQNVSIRVTPDEMAGRFTSSNPMISKVNFFILAGTESLSYEWDGKLINVVPGTVFMDFCLGFGVEGMDMIVMFTPAGTFSAVPVPAAVWFFGSGLAGIAVLRRKLA